MRRSKVSIQCKDRCREKHHIIQIVPVSCHEKSGKPATFPVHIKATKSLTGPSNFERRRAAGLPESLAISGEPRSASRDAGALGNRTPALRLPAKGEERGRAIGEERRKRPDRNPRAELLKKEAEEGSPLWRVSCRLCFSFFF